MLSSRVNKLIPMGLVAIAALLSQGGGPEALAQGSDHAHEHAGGYHHADCDAMGLRSEGRASNGNPLCSHGGDPVDEMWTTYDEVVLDPSTAPPPAPCASTNTATTKVTELIYAVPSNIANSYSADLDSLRRKAARADVYLDDSSENVDQHLRWQCNSSSQVLVHNVTIIAQKDYYTRDASGNCVLNLNDPRGSITTQVDVQCSLESQVAHGLGPVDYETTGKVYGVFVDDVLYARNISSTGVTTDTQVGGVGQGGAGWCRPHMATCYDGPGYGIVGSTNWTAFTLLHEISHVFGAVQGKNTVDNHYPPHATKSGGHCFDDYDVLCYDDEPPKDGWTTAASGGAVQIQIVCANEPKWKVDCFKDDYYDPRPTSTEYLGQAGHPNMATNPYLTPFTVCTNGC